VRAAATFVFWVTGVVAVLLTFPVAALLRLTTLPFDPDRRAVGAWLRWLARTLLRACPFWRVSVEGAVPPPPQRYVVVPNHRSMLDALAVGCVPGETKWMGKASAFSFPWLGWAFHLAGYVPVVRGDRGSGARALARMRAWLDRGLPVGVFAEGSRSRAGGLQPFRAGPFKLAAEAGVPIVPVAITGAGEAMPADQPFVRPARIRIRILDPIATAGLGPGAVDRLRDETRARIARALADGGDHLPP